MDITLKITNFEILPYTKQFISISSQNIFFLDIKMAPLDDLGFFPLLSSELTV